MQPKQLIIALIMAASAAANLNTASAADAFPKIGVESRSIALTGTPGFDNAVASRFDSEPQNDPEAEVEAELMLLSSPDLVNRPKR